MAYNDRMIWLTETRLMEGSCSRTGSWNRKQLALIGVPWPPPKGWKDWVIGTPLDEDVFWEFVRLGGRYGKASEGNDVPAPSPVRKAFAPKGKKKRKWGIEMFPSVERIGRDYVRSESTECPFDAD